ncbi:dihydrofolate reductase family protein [Streptomyces sp. S4.7]|uniref:dihydrofolate reductase family protein n=1 Tax=Streptomyces sp. S4.7 TaxID=2705439 RepID=UPI0031BB7AA1
MRKYVASRTADTVSWQNSTLLTGDVAEAVRALKQDSGDGDGDGVDSGEIQVHGSGDLIQTLIEHDLVDEFHVLVLPVLVGSGKRLFGAGTVPAGLKLLEHREFRQRCRHQHVRAGGRGRVRGHGPGDRQLVSG